MPGLFSKVFKKEGTPKKAANGAASEPAKPRWDDAWARNTVQPEEVQELLHGCTAEIKSRALETPFLLLPFRPASDISAARTFVRNFFGPGLGNDPPMSGDKLKTELRLAEPLVLCSVMKWCWARLAGGVVTWDAYELFKIGENDSNMAKDAFSTFIPISTANEARTKIITDFFDLIAAIASHSKSNGFPGRKLSRYAAWWAFDHKAEEGGFDDGYAKWAKAADATSHLFFAYLRSLAPDAIKGALSLPRSLQHLLEQTEYPPNPRNSLRSEISKVVMIVKEVSPTPFALLRRAKNFEFRSSDEALQAFAEFDDPMKAITDESRRILHGIATANESSSSKLSTSLRDASWSRFEDIGFSEAADEDVKKGILNESALTKKRSQRFEGLQSLPASTVDIGRPTTPSWADFLSSGFVEQQNSTKATSLLSPDKQLPPLNIRGSSSYSERPTIDTESNLDEGELASVKGMLVDDVFWWVWVSSLSSEETLTRKSTFGRCALVETKLRANTWLLFEEIIRGAKAEPEDTGYVVEKKSRFGFRKMSKKGKNTPQKSVSGGKQSTPSTPTTKKPIAPDQHARIQAAAAALSQKKAASDAGVTSPERRGRNDPDSQAKTSSVLTLQPVIMNEAAPAMKWARSYDKNEVRSQYLGNKFAGKGSAVDLPSAESRSIAPSDISREPPQPSNANLHPSAAETATPEKPPTLDTSAPTRVPVAAAAEVSTTPKHDQAAPALGVPSSAVPLRSSSQVKTDGLVAGPEYGNQTPTKAPEQPAVPAQNSPTASNKISRKLPGRLGSVFSRKKVDDEKDTAKSVPNRAASSAASGGSAVAAARAVLEAKTQQSSPAPKQQITTKRTSLVTDSATERADEAAQPTSPHDPTAAAAAAVAIQTPAAGSTAAAEAQYPDNTYARSYTTSSHIDEAEHVAAEREFSKFDHEPEHDIPVHEEPQVDKVSPKSEHVEPEIEKQGGGDVTTTTALPAVADNKHEAASTEAVAQPVKQDDVGDHSANRERSSSDDRLAQIRKNAADRVAARQDDDKSRASPNADEGDDDDEEQETIESRVARIKARVKELTGNMEIPSHESHDNHESPVKVES